MHIVYIDDSGDLNLGVFSALVIPVNDWRTVFDAVKSYRQMLHGRNGIYVKKELHAVEFLAGQGKIAPNAIPKGKRAALFVETLDFISTLRNVLLFNATFPRKKDEWGYERLMNRINRTMLTLDSHALIVCDEGKEGAYTRLSRRMSVFNPIPSRHGGWGPLRNPTKNITTKRIIEDPVFKSSETSYFIQLVDFVAYALLRRERPTPRILKYGLENAFDRLAPICFKGANKNDALGIVRIQ